ncbi:MAG: hypothetical protein MUC92_13640, partial [Fimbriimonadaceae bacterium]|nr:hypothetical protein [Fimbriimonadaceae bacterium]
MSNTLFFPVRILPVLLLTLFSCLAWAEEAWTGVYLNGNKIGYTSVREEKLTRPGTTSKRVFQMRLNGTMMNQTLQMEVDSTTWLGAKGQVSRMTYTITSAG